jgi:O-antigen/teichoic acid export membrane protein
MCGQPGIVTALRIGALEILLMPVARAHRDALLGTSRYGNAGLTGGVFHFVRLAAVVALLLMGVGIETVVCAHVAGRLAEIAWCRRFLAIPLTGGPAFLPTSLGRLLAPTFLNAICVRIVDSLDILLLSALGASGAVLGHYSAAAMLAQLPRMLNLVVAPGLIVGLTKAGQAGDHGLAAAIREDSARLIATVSALLLVAAGAAPTILLILFGADFVPAAGILRILLAGGVGIIIFVMISAELFAANRPWMPVLISLPMLILSGVLLLTLIPRFGAEGAASATAVSYALAGAVVLWLTRRGAPGRIRHVAIGLGAGAVGGCVAAFLSSQGAPILDGIAGIVVAVALLYAGKVIDRNIVSRFLNGMRTSK